MLSIREAAHALESVRIYEATNGERCHQYAGSDQTKRVKELKEYNLSLSITHKIAGPWFGSGWG